MQRLTLEHLEISLTSLMNFDKLRGIERLPLKTLYCGRDCGSNQLVTLKFQVSLLCSPLKREGKLVEVTLEESMLKEGVS